MAEVTVELNVDRIKVRIGGLLHLSLAGSKLLGVQSWRWGDKSCFIEYAFAGGNILCEYDDEAKWKAILAGIDRVL